MEAMELLSTRASNMSLGEPAPDEATLEAIFRAALRAPDHAALRPWRIFVIRGPARERFGDLLARMHAEDDPGASADAIERTRRKPTRAPLLVVVAATPHESPKAPEIEQVISAGLVTHSILLGLQANGFAGAWRTGGAAYDPRVKQALGLRESDHVVALLYVGTPTAAPPAARRPDPGDHVVEWTGPEQ